MTRTSAIRIIRASAVYDLLLTASFALAWTAAPTFDTIAWIHEGLGSSGTLPAADSTFTMLFANLMGSLVTVWSVLRLLRPSLVLGAADAAARALFSIGFAVALGSGGTTVLLGFLVVELAWFVVQGAAVASAYRGSIRPAIARTVTT